ncbi:MAG: biosynthetic-type acetolactate synthase large subunit [Clostridia bacterium]|nr:biosynthetic-type acetolactate synthase large subunit [Clostridia bacterium]
MKLSGAQIVIECLNAQKVETIFGFPGGAVIPLYDALYDAKYPMKHYRTCHEQGAVHAADGYARTTGKVGVCIVTSGPGATNTITGIATAYMDSVPLVIITGQVGRPLLGRDSFQEVDITAMTLTITKHCEMVKTASQIESTLMRAFEIARSGRPGPVLIDIPKDIMIQVAEYRGEVMKPNSVHQELDHEAIQIAIDALKNAKNPVILAGGGVGLASASNVLKEFAARSNIPVVNTLMGSGAFPQSHHLSYGLIGMHGSVAANSCLSNSDVILAIGARFSDRVVGASEKFCSGAKIIQVDIDINEVGKNKEIMYPIVGDLGKVLSIFSEKLDGYRWESRSDAGKKCDVDHKAKQMLSAIRQTFGEDAIVVTEVGQHQMWTAQYYGFEKTRKFITSGGLGTMGFGLGAAIGSQIGNPEQTVVHIAGDGSFKMNSNELGTVSKYNIPIKTFVINNNALGMVRQWQRMFCESRFSETDGDDSVDFVKLAEAYGIAGYRVKSQEELEAVLKKIKNNKSPVVVDCIIDHDENVYPIIPPGKGITEMVTAFETLKREVSL